MTSPPPGGGSPLGPLSGGRTDRLPARCVRTRAIAGTLPVNRRRTEAGGRDRGGSVRLARGRGAPARCRRAAPGCRPPRGRPRRARPRLQRLSGPVSRPPGGGGGRDGAAHVGRRVHRLPPGHRQHPAARRAGDRARLVPGGASRAGLLLGVRSEPGGADRPVRSGALVVSDAGNHASIVDACRLSRARVAVVGHGDVAAVRAALAARSEPRAVVVTDSVFSVDGDLAPLAGLHAACREHGASARRRRGARPRRPRPGRARAGARGGAFRGGRRGPHGDPVEVARQPGRRGRGRRPRDRAPDRRCADVHLRHRTRPARGRRRPRRPAGAAGRTRAGGARMRAGAAGWRPRSGPPYRHRLSCPSSSASRTGRCGPRGSASSTASTSAASAPRRSPPGRAGCG